ncbi:MAG: aldose 1-epimerase family protein [Pirellulaceae bacterium]|nr:aldose 1-epimerase family protein [Pirellulaceae bacterium]
MHIELPPAELTNWPASGRLLDEPLTSKLGDFSVGHVQLTQGRQAGCQLIVVDGGRARVAICPTRGMSLWKARLDGIDCQWNSPVHGPIHPSWVAINDSTGIGWLDGFDELLVRCGLRSFGAPDIDAQGHVRFPLHGRIGNLPAQNVRCDLSDDGRVLTITGEVYETRFLVYNLRLQARYRIRLGDPAVDIHDTVTNLAGQSTSMQMLYHINFGRPLLGGGAQLHLATRQVTARDARAAQDIDSWSLYLPPTGGYAEQVYFSQPIAGQDGWVEALLTSADQTQAAAVRYQRETLPYFTHWKNTAAEADGYVTGLEPGTGYPNPRSIEEQQGRLVELEPGQSRDFKVQLVGISNRERIQQWSQRIAMLTGQQAARAASE